VYFFGTGFSCLSIWDVWLLAILLRFELLDGNTTVELDLDVPQEARKPVRSMQIKKIRNVLFIDFIKLSGLTVFSMEIINFKFVKVIKILYHFNV
jgi:hypothetical protein